ncbi:MAG: 50S ribosomal protein L15 [Gemmatimonadota bacterium]|nr:50S ribosomal protein L15 [Gemmatimonadota bacterium]MDH5284539.1 50S ribosomal protein L15 [Gemmatimonadota bacterium]
MADQTTPVTLSTLRPARGAKHTSKRLGRGPGSGKGKTSGKGHKGHKARQAGGTNPGFEGGQMPMYRRLPKRGFTNPFKVTAQPVNVKDLERLTATEVNPDTLHAAGLVSKRDVPVKLLGTGTANRAYTVQGVAVSASAREKIEQAGGKIAAE